MVFLSERDQFSIDLYLADAVTGRVIRQAVDDGDECGLREPAVSALRRGVGLVGHAIRARHHHARPRHAGHHRRRPSRRIAASCRWPDVDEVYSPTWSPDGTRIAFSALAGGVSDLSVVRARDRRHPPADRRSLRRSSAGLVAGRNGHRVHDRSIHHRSVVAGVRLVPHRAASTRPAAAIVPAPSVAGINHLDPEWSGDGSLFFVGDPEGVPNVFRLDRCQRRRVAGHQHHDGRGRRHARQSRRCRWRATPARLPSACSATAAYEVHRIDAPSPVEARGNARGSPRARRGRRPTRGPRRGIAPCRRCPRSPHSATEATIVRGCRSKASGRRTSRLAADRSAATCRAAPRCCSAICSATISC